MANTIAASFDPGPLSMDGIPGVDRPALPDWRLCEDDRAEDVTCHLGLPGGEVRGQADGAPRLAASAGNYALKIAAGYVPHPSRQNDPCYFLPRL
jgi:hypothetical protein